MLKLKLKYSVFRGEIMSYILNYFCKSSQQRLNKKIMDINSKRKKLKYSNATGMYKDLKKLSYTSIYKNKPITIKKILNDDYTNLEKLLTITVAESILHNMKLKPDAKTYAIDPKISEQLRYANMEFNTLTEIYWGNTKEIIQYESDIYYSFILCFCLDFLENKKTQDIMKKNLMSYTPFAKYIAYENAIKNSKDNSLMSLLIGDNFKYDNIDVLGEAIYNFSKTQQAREIAHLFVECINSTVEFESKDSNRRYLKKTEIVYFRNFQDIFEENIDKFLKIISVPKNNLGDRLFTIINEDCELIFEITHADISGFLQDRYLSETEESLYDIYKNLFNSNSKYINDLIDFQKKLEGDIEDEYFDKNPFGDYKSQYYCEERFLNFHFQKQIELETLIELEESKKLKQLLLKHENEQ